MDALKKNILAGTIAPVYLLYGPESYLKEELTAMIKTAVFPSESDAACNTQVLYAADLTLGEVV